MARLKKAKSKNNKIKKASSTQNQRIMDKLQDMYPNATEEELMELYNQIDENPGSFPKPEIVAAKGSLIGFSKLPKDVQQKISPKLTKLVEKQSKGNTDFRANKGGLLMSVLDRRKNA